MIVNRFCTSRHYSVRAVCSAWRTGTACCLSTPLCFSGMLRGIEREAIKIAAGSQDIAAGTSERF